MWQEQLGVFAKDVDRRHRSDRCQAGYTRCVASYLLVWMPCCESQMKSGRVVFKRGEA